MSDLNPFHEITLAPTSRASCNGRCKKTGAHKIEIGELKFVSYYVPRGRNHFESSAKALRCVSTDEAKAVLDGTTKSGIEVKIHGDVSTAARKVAMDTARAIADGLDLSEELCAFREVPAKKPREAKKRKTPELNPVERTQARTCSVCKVNFPRSNEPGATCNACRPKAEVEAEKQAQAEIDTREKAREKRVDEVVCGLPSKCLCGNHPRLWKTFNTFLQEFEGKMDSSIVDKTYDDDDALDEHVDGVLEKYSTHVADLLATDPRCNACAASDH
jgi:hypothetical protein